MDTLLINYQFINDFDLKVIHYYENGKKKYEGMFKEN